eukprot:750745-Hanusia_phi.AAC.2
MTDISGKIIISTDIGQGVGSNLYNQPTHLCGNMGFGEKWTWGQEDEMSWRGRGGVQQEFQATSLALIEANIPSTL